LRALPSKIIYIFADKLLDTLVYKPIVQTRIKFDQVALNLLPEARALLGEPKEGKRGGNLIVGPMSHISRSFFFSLQSDLSFGSLLLKSELNTFAQRFWKPMIGCRGALDEYFAIFCAIREQKDLFIDWTIFNPVWKSLSECLISHMEITHETSIEFDYDSFNDKEGYGTILAGLTLPLHHILNQPLSSPNESNHVILWDTWESLFLRYPSFHFISLFISSFPKVNDQSRDDA